MLCYYVILTETILKVLFQLQWLQLDLGVDYDSRSDKNIELFEARIHLKIPVGGSASVYMKLVLDNLINVYGFRNPWLTMTTITANVKSCSRTGQCFATLVFAFKFKEN